MPSMGRGTPLRFKNLHSSTDSASWWHRIYIDWEIKEADIKKSLKCPHGKELPRRPSCCTAQVTHIEMRTRRSVKPQKYGLPNQSVYDKKANNYSPRGDDLPTAEDGGTDRRTKILKELSLTILKFINLLLYNSLADHVYMNWARFIPFGRKVFLVWCLHYYNCLRRARKILI